MFLAAIDILGPVARVGVLIVEQATDTELLCCRPVPARPVARARGLVPEDAVQPIAVLGTDRWVWWEDWEYLIIKKCYEAICLEPTV